MSKPIRKKLSWEETWEGNDRGLIFCWEVGRNLRQNNPDLAKLAVKGELPVLGWKGGIEKELKKKEKFGTLNYLAQWQGLRGEDLDIDLREEPEVTCSRTGVKVIFTNDLKKYGNA